MLEVLNLSRILQVPERMLPPTVGDYRRYVDDLLENTLEDHPTVHDVLAAIRFPLTPPFLPPALRRLCIPAGSTTAALLHFIVLGTLPAAFRDKFGLAWSAADERRFHWICYLIRRTVPRLPERARYLPIAHQARQIARQQPAWTTVSRGSLTSGAATGAAVHSVKPNKVNELDCNGWSKKYQTVRKMAGGLCTDPFKYVHGRGSRFIDNGWYVGHDELSVKFISAAPGSGNTMSYLMRMSRDPAAAPTATGSVTDYGQLSVAPWFGLPLCDPKSYPQNSCTPDSDTNSGLNNDPNAAGSAFMELQFYPPGFTPFVDSTSCSATKWCAALTIDSLECTFGFATCNNNCIEPVNFAFLQTNGVPAGPPSPQLTDVSSFIPDAHTLMINPGDVLAVSITDPPGGLRQRSEISAPVRPGA